MRDLIRAFEDAVKAQLVGRGWRRTGGIYVLPLAADFDAWLGLNRASAGYPLRINPVMGLRLKPVQQLLGELLVPVLRTQPTLSVPIGYLMPSRTFLQVEVGTIARAEFAATEVSDLVEQYGLPAMRPYVSIPALLDAIRRQEYVISSDWQQILLPAVEYVTGDYISARTHVIEGLAYYGDNLAHLNVAQYHQFAAGLLARLDA